MKKIQDLFTKVRKWLIVKLGGYTDGRISHVHTMKIEREDVIPLRVCSVISQYDMGRMFDDDINLAEAYVTKDIAHKLAEGLAEYIVIQHSYDYELNAVTFRGTIKVVDPNLKRSV